jgi:drug/metabolite transporter (DMT)-like permease
MNASLSTHSPHNLRSRLASGIAILLLGQLVASTAVIAIKASTLNPVLLSSFRLLVAAVALVPVYLRDSRRAGRTPRDMAREALPSLVPGVLLALHFISWNYGARLTLAANATLIVNLMPVAMPFIVYAMSRKLIRAREAVGTVISMTGVLLLTGNKLGLGGPTVPGDLICFVAMIFFSVYMSLGARNNRQPSLWLYVVPLYWIAGIISLVVAIPLVAVNGIWQGNAAPAHLASEILIPVYLGLFPTIIGHTIFNRSMKNLPSQIVSVGMLSQFIFAGILAFFLFGEMPNLLFVPAAVLVVAGAVLVIKVVR